LKMNPHKCAFGVSTGKFLGFVIHEHGIEIDPDRIKSIRNVGPPTCKVEVQKFLGKVNYLRRFISNLAGRLVDAETRYTFIEKLCLCLFYACTKCRCYLLSSHCLFLVKPMRSSTCCITQL
jgi:hypothetical protein